LRFEAGEFWSEVDDGLRQSHVDGCRVKDGSDSETD
jgi:hypothetical protein